MLVRLGYNGGCNLVSDAYQVSPGPPSTMTYRFALDRTDYSDFATGRVLHSVPGRTAFPIRLADEIFQRCLEWLPEPVKSGRVVLYDPVCGSGALLATLALLHGNRIAALVGSDADPEALHLAERNLALVTPAGMDQRIGVLSALRDRYGKASHAEALASAGRLRTIVVEPPIAVRLFLADATDRESLSLGLTEALLPERRGRPHPDPLPLGEGMQSAVIRYVDYKALSGGGGVSPLPLGEGQGEGVSFPLPLGEGEGRPLARREAPPPADVVIADVPHGMRSFWSGDAGSAEHDPLWHLLEALRPVLAQTSVVAIASDKSQRPRHDAYIRREWFQVGKRRIEILSQVG